MASALLLEALIPVVSASVFLADRIQGAQSAF
jgi:hypothetical protein